MLRLGSALLVSLMLVSDARADPAPPPGQQATAVLSAWLAAQNRADATAYLALYDGQHFRGKKRTHHGTKAMDWKAWAADRTAMLKSHPTVVAEKITVETWQDRGSKLQRGVVRLRFLQRWKSARYADHGIKILDLAFDTKKNAWLIFYEDLLNSEPGFADPPREASKLRGNIATVEDAGRALATLGLTAGDQSQLSFLPEAPQVLQLFVAAILGGELACDRVTKETQCGEEIVEWSALDPKLAWPDPCVRRRAAIWAVAQADDRTLAHFTPQLEALFSVGEPERELPEAILARARTASDAQRIVFLKAAARWHAKLANASLDGLSLASLATVAAAAHLDEAALSLDPKAQRAAFLEALTDGALAVGTRKTLTERVAPLRGKDLDAALRKVSDDDADCEVSVIAASILATHGDPSRLPRRPANGTVEEMGRAVCRILHDPDAERGTARWRELLPAKGKVVLSEELDNEWAERDEEGHRIQTKIPDKILRRDTTTRDDLPTVGDLHHCDGTSCELDAPQGHLEVTFDKGFIKNLHYVRWEGCGC